MPAFLLSALPYLLKFWKPILLGVLVVGLGYYINRWDNQRLEAAYKAGAKAVQDHYADQERKIAKEAEVIARENARELAGELEAVRKVNEVNHEQVNTVITIYEKEITECSPHPEYLRVWDNLTSDRTGVRVGHDKDSTEPIKEVSGTP